MRPTLPRARRATLRVALRATLLATLLACGDGPTGPRVADIVFQPTELRLRQRESHIVSVRVADAQGTLIAGVPVAFTSSDERIVTVTSLGEVKSIGPAGTAAVRATAAGVTRSLTVVVQEIPTRVQVTPSPVTLPQKGTAQLTARLLDLVDNPIPGQTFTFQPTDQTLVTVDPSGLVTSLGRHGTTTVAVRSGELATSVDVTVTQVATDMQVSAATLALAPSRTARLEAWIVDAVGAVMPAPGPFTYETSNAAIATVAGDGTVTSGSALGEATITVRQGTYTRTVTVRVVAAAHPQGRIERTISVPGAFGVAITPANVAYAVSLSNGVLRLDVNAGFAAAVAGGARGLDLAVTADGTRAYVARQDARRVDLVDLATGAILRSSAELGDAALTDVLGPDEQTLWVGTGSGIAVLDAGTLQTVQTLPAGTVVHLARHPSLPYVYASSNGNTVREIDVASRTVRRTFTVGSRTQGVAVSPDGAELYVADESGPVHVLSLATGQKVGEIVVSPGSPFSGGYGLAMSPDGLRLYVTLSQRGQLVIADPAARSVLTTLAVPGTPRRMAMDRAGTLLLIASEGGSVTVVR